MPLATGQITIQDVTDASSLSIETPDGVIFQGNSGNPKTVNVKLRRAGVDVTNLATIRWYFNGTENAGMVNNTTLELYPADVAGHLILKITAVLDGVTYENSVSFIDLADTYQVSIIGNDKITTPEETIDLKAKVFRGPVEITDGFRCRWSNINGASPVVIYEGINTTGTLAERGVTISINATQLNEKMDILCELSVDTVEQELDLTENTYVPSYDSKAYAAAMGVALS